MGTQRQDQDVVFLSGKRTGFGTFGGSLKDFSATDLGVIASRAARGSLRCATGSPRIPRAT